MHLILFIRALGRIADKCACQPQTEKQFYRAMSNVRKLATRFNRRLVTILAGDVADYCRLMGADDEATLSQLLDYRQLIDDSVASGGGRMFGVAGDSWMAEFASPVEATRSAMECQRSIEARNSELPEEKRVRFRIGIHMGDVIANNSNLFGDEVNIAARLQQICRPGHLVVSDEVFRHVLGKIDVRFSALGLQRLKNIETSVSAYTADIIAASGSSAPQHLSSGVDVSKPVPGFHGKPAIAVLPFKTLGGESGSEYLGEGFAEDLVNGLSNVRWFPVISRCSSFIFQNHAIETASIGRALGARYLVTGSMRPSGKDFRLIVNLIDAESGLNLWSHRYQIGFSEFLDTQDEISACIVSVLNSEIERAEHTRLRTREVKDLELLGAHSPGHLAHLQVHEGRCRHCARAVRGGAAPRSRLWRSPHPALVVAFLGRLDEAARHFRVAHHREARSRSGAHRPARRKGPAPDRACPDDHGPARGSAHPL